MTFDTLMYTYTRQYSHTLNMITKNLDRNKVNGMKKKIECIHRRKWQRMKIMTFECTQCNYGFILEFVDDVLGCGACFAR